jgi:FKBP-type peptidyl-prolyl cis-trans isomerase 2
MKQIQLGDTVTVNYTGRLEDGSIFDSSLNEGREPLKSTLGQGQLIHGFENGLLNMAIGEKKTIEIEPENAYGEYNPDMTTIVGRNQVPETIQVGETLQGNTPNGPIIVKVLEVTQDSVTLDANHPLAGKKLIFDLEVVDIS